MIIIHKNINNFFKKNSLPKKSESGFTLIEILMYIFIMAIMFVIITSMVMTIFNARKQLRASHTVYNNTRFVVNFLTNKIHNVDIIDDVSPAPEILHFYQMPDTRFSLAVEDDNLVYRETIDSGSGFPSQSTADPVYLNTNDVVISNFILTPISDAHGNNSQGVKIDFTITISDPSDSYGYLQRDFSTFISIR